MKQKTHHQCQRIELIIQLLFLLNHLNVLKPFFVSFIKREEEEEEEEEEAEEVHSLYVRFDELNTQKQNRLKEATNLQDVILRR